ncbi:MAG: hypothetical protein NC218_10365 [Acetobacter sp.]|nr:hypothetical protein [Acetobacter sp.]
MKKKILFSYYLQKLAQMEQELLGVNDQRAALLAVVLAKTNLFRRFPSGCTMQELCFCNPRYAQELFVYICLKAKENGGKLRSLFDFSQIQAHYPAMWGQPYIEDREISRFLDKVFPEVKSKREIDTSLYTKLLAEIPENELGSKFVQLSNFRNVNIEAMCHEPCAETAIVDAALAEMKGDAVLRNMLTLNGKCDIYAKSPAYKGYLNNISDFPRAH